MDGMDKMDKMDKTSGMFQGHGHYWGQVQMSGSLTY